MATPAPSTVSPPPASGGIDNQTILIIVAAAAGTLFLIVVLLLFIVAYLYFRKDRISQKKKTELENRHRLFREPSNLNSKFADIADLQDLEQASFFREMLRSSMRSQRSRRGSVRSTRSSVRSNLSRKNSRRKNPTFGQDDVYAGALELKVRNRRGQTDEPPTNVETANQQGIDNPVLDVSDERDSPPQENQGLETNPPDTASTVVTEAKVNILNPQTWKRPDAEEDEVPPASNEKKVFTISGSNQETTGHAIVPEKEELYDDDDGEIQDDREDEDDEDEEAEEEDTYHMFSQLQRANSQRRRSFRTPNSAVIDFYEGGAFNSAPKIERKEERPEERDPFWDGFGPSSSSTAQGLLWQKKRIF